MLQQKLDEMKIEEIEQKLRQASINYYNDQYEALDNSSCLFIVTEWKNYRKTDFELIYKSMISPMIIDGRNIYIHEKDIENKFIYYCIGK